MKKTIYSKEYQTLLNWLRRCREEKSLSMRALAQKLDVHHSWIGKVELGERRLDVVEYVRLCAALDVNPGNGIAKIISLSHKKLVYHQRRSTLKKVAEKSS